MNKHIQLNPTLSWSYACQNNNRGCSCVGQVSFGQMVFDQKAWNLISIYYLLSNDCSCQKSGFKSQIPSRHLYQTISSSMFAHNNFNLNIKS
jgi:hypothetical protein